MHFGILLIREHQTSFFANTINVFMNVFENEFGVEEYNGIINNTSLGALSSPPITWSSSCP